jgi:hypothetical protein
MVTRKSVENEPFPLKLFILFLSASLPFSFGNLGPVPDFLWIEAIGPIAFVYGICHLRVGQHPFPYDSRIFVIAICALGLWALLHYFSNPVLSKNLTRANQYNEGIRAYYTIFVGACIFFSSLWFSCYWMEGKNSWQRILAIIIWISLIVGFARLITYFLHLELPLLKGVFDYGGSGEFSSEHTRYRIGGLSEAATLGISALLSLYYGKKWSMKFILLLISYVFLLLMSGGRSATFGVLVALFLHVAFIERRRIGWALLYGPIIVSFVLIGFHYGFLEGQFERITSIEGGFAQQDTFRYQTYQYMWEIFLDVPIMGKGIGYISLNRNLDSFVSGQLVGGGHGAYLSILMVFGLGGAFFLLVTLFGSIFTAFITMRKSGKSGDLTEDQLKILIYILTLLIILSVEFIAGGSGFNNMRLYLLAGILSGVVSRGRNGT